MKIAVSLPDDVFGAAERHARRMGVSRSRLYAMALSDYLKSRQRTDVKDALDRVYGSRSSSVDPILQAMQQAPITGDDW